MKYFEFTLEEMLLQDTKEVIVRNADLLRIRINKSHKKAVIAQRVAETILREPLILLHNLPFQEVLKLQKMVHAKDHSVPEPPYLVPDCITQIGLTDSRWDGTHNREFIYPDLAKALRPVIDTFVNSIAQRATKIRREQLVLGLLNFYGILSLSELTDLCHTFDPECYPNVLMQTIFGSYLLHSREFLLDERIIYTSPFLADPEYMLKEISGRTSIARAEFTLEEIMAAGDAEFPVPPYSKALADVRLQLAGMVKSDEETDQWISQVWMVVNNDRDEMAFIKKLLEKHSISINTANRILSSIVNWRNNLPQWILKGHTSQFVFETYEKPRFMKQPPQITIGTNMQKMEISLSQEKFNEMWKNKVGRNDPCPCGSGKKFKHCCGKN